jgi:predicted enzyme related to lactoylglutathione lyase
MALYRVRQIGFDGGDLDRMVEFWLAALGYELDHLTEAYAILRDPDGVEPRLFLQKVPEAKVGKNRAHIDIEVADEQVAVDRIVALGATIQWREDSAPHHWTVLADPEGNEFCVGYFG